MADPEESSQQPEELARALSQLSPRLKGLSHPTPGEPWRRQGQGGRGRERGREPGSLPRNRGAGQGRSPLTRSERSSLSLRPLLCTDPQLLPLAGPRASQVSCRASHSTNAREQKLQARAQLCCPTWRRPAASKSSPLARAAGCSGFPSHRRMGSHKSFSPVRAPHPQSRAETQTPPGYLYPNARQRQHPGPEPQAEKHTQTRTRLARPAQSKLAPRYGLGFVCLFVLMYLLTLLSPVPLPFGYGYRCSTRMGLWV